MQKIKYEFADGMTSEIEVSDEIYAVHIELANEEKRNNKRETRRHTSLTYFDNLGIEFESNAADPLSALIRRDDEERIHNAIKHLSDKQRALLEKVFNQNMSLREIERESEPKTWAAFLRRITAVYNFDISKDTPVSKHTGELRKPSTLIPIDDDSDLPF